MPCRKLIGEVWINKNVSTEHAYLSFKHCFTEQLLPLQIFKINFLAKLYSFILDLQLFAEKVSLIKLA